MYNIDHILNIIKAYSGTYALIEELQANLKEFPSNGDQKTGVIAEFYSYLYLKKIYPYASAIHHVEKGKDNFGWDINITFPDGSNKLIQVKAVSDYSSKRKISHIKPGFDDLYLVALNKDFKPVGFWINKATQFTSFPIKNKRMANPNEKIYSNQVLDFSNNLIEDLIESLKNFR